MNANVGGVGVWREGNLLVATKDAVFPPRCIKCNAPVNGPPIKRTYYYYWHTPWLALLILVQLFIYIIVALIVRKSGRVQIYVCDRHRARRRWLLISAWLSLLASIASFIGAGIVSDNRAIADTVTPLLVILGIALILAALILGFSLSRQLWPTRIDDRQLWLRGAGREFLSTLDETGVVLRR